ncbi:hypothetical protein B0F90DRAFT_1910679 [Multifurca ochricompacta]|uniref:Cysteine proteinase 1, mitochondrial n=1 Tax=Multifurca ochricompacta TaxID=376703 RepID=A0AAD4M845_9AGAM|nr:hypothetical protein B0F90DRAFT_1910679 [Multifurca ochricompacta]
MCSTPSKLVQCVKEAAAEASAKTQLARAILSHSNFRDVLVTNVHVFNTELDFKTGPITNQKSSGRCWLFATTNVLRYEIMKKFNLKEFQLDIISDGGQWDIIVNLLENYGVIPLSVFPESTHSSLSGPLNGLLKTKLREHALVLRELSSSLRGAGKVSDVDIIAALRSRKEELLGEVYRVMSATLGVPPQPNDKFVTNGLYTVDKLGNVWGGRPVLYVNTEIENMKNAVIKTLKAGQPVFFGCDVGQFSESSSGIMDTELFEYENAFDISLSLSKADRLRTNESAMTHAMVISGVHLDHQNGKPLRYKVENSWGESRGEKGFFVMTDRWFDEFVYQVVVPKSLAPKELVRVFESSEKTVLPPWDPMGSLA